MKKIFLVLLVVCNVHYAFSQKDEKVTMEEVKQQCSAMPLEKRARLSVTRFSVTTSTPQSSNTTSTAANNRLNSINKIFGGNRNGDQTGNIPPTLGDNLTTMLTNALQGVNCYRVLESLNNNEDLTKEIDAGNGGYANKKTPKAGKQMGAQIVVTGEVIEYSVNNKGVSVVGVGSKKQTIKMGFNLKMINPETRDVIVSRVFRVQSRSGKSVSVLGLVNTGNSDPAVAAVMEDGVIEAVEYLAKMRDSLNITSAGNFAGNGNSDGTVDTEIDFSHITHDQYTSVTEMIKAISGYKSMDKSFSAGAGSFTVSHTGSDDDFQDLLIKKLGGRYEVTGQNPGKLELKGK
jgi:curli biogenesis system outer membrane secretion channel CsgG